MISVEGWCFCAGSLPIKVAESIARSFKEELREANSPALRGVKVNIETYKETPAAAFGNGSGIVVVAKTSTGCVLGNFIALVVVSILSLYYLRHGNVATISSVINQFFNWFITINVWNLLEKSHAIKDLTYVRILRQFTMGPEAI